MQREIDLEVTPDRIHDLDHQKSEACRLLRIESEELTHLRIVRRSIDARSKTPFYRIKAVAYIHEAPTDLPKPLVFEPVRSDRRVIVVGSGPAGLFAALRLLALGLRPVLLERGKDVTARRKDIAAIQRFGRVDADSNYCFGEGGAGTFSDGKLYTRSTKRGNIQRIMGLLIQHGAPGEIAVDAHPHIGSNRLPRVVQAIRETIRAAGGEIHFQSRVTDLILQRGKARGVVVEGRRELTGEAVILATGHSARDVFYFLNRRGLSMEPKPFAAGVRIEHPQELIDRIRYHAPVRHRDLPAASYNLSCQVEGRGVYSFCMCPGGLIIPASTSQEELVLNGMSVSGRNSPFANAGLVVTVTAQDWNPHEEHGIFAGLMYQKEIEEAAFRAGGGNQKAPAQRVTDFVAGTLSAGLAQTSYLPGTTSSPLHEILPENISGPLRKGILLLDRKMKGFFSQEAQILAPETRTSSPLRVLRNEETLMHVEADGLFPCGEGAGYAGGIVSAAIDGDLCAQAVGRYLL